MCKESADVMARLRGAAKKCHVDRLEEIDSTNSELKRRAAAGAPDGTVVIARRQTGGRGRLGRTFFSPEGGLYMSLLLRQEAQSPELSLLTIAAATAVAEAAEELTASPLAVKWVNDLYRDGRKVCGILTEAMTDGVTGECCAVVGIGVNLVPPQGGFPAELKDTAGALLPSAPNGVAEQLAAKILDRLLPYAAALSARAYLPGYRARSMLDGETVTFCQSGVWRQGVAQGIDDSGGLIVRLPDGSSCVLSCGEVTLHRAGG